MKITQPKESETAQPSNGPELQAKGFVVESRIPDSGALLEAEGSKEALSVPKTPAVKHKKSITAVGILGFVATSVGCTLVLDLHLTWGWALIVIGFVLDVLAGVLTLWEIGFLAKRREKS